MAEAFCLRSSLRLAWGLLAAVALLAGCRSTSPAPAVSEDALQRFLLGASYPYERAPGSFLWAREQMLLYADVPDDGNWLRPDLPLQSLARGPVRTLAGWLADLDAVPADWSQRVPVLAYGANAAPSAMARKFAPERFEGERTIPTLRARLSDFDVVWMAGLSFNGAPPAMLAWSPGTTVEVWVNWLDPAQLARMDASEGLGFAYSTGWLRNIRLELEGGQVLEAARVYAGIMGALPAPELAAPLAVAAVPAEGRRFGAVDAARAAQLAAGDDPEASAPLQFVFRHVTDDVARDHSRARLARHCLPLQLPRAGDDAVPPVPHYVPDRGDGLRCPRAD